MEIADIKKHMKLHKITYEMLSDKSGIPLATLKDIFRGATANPRIDTMKAITTALNIDNNQNNDIDLSGMQILHYRTSYKNTIVVYDNSGDKYEFNFDKKELEHILKVCEALTADYKKLDY